MKPHSRALTLGVIYALSSTFMICVMNMFAKLLSSYDFHAVELVFWRNLFGIFCIGGIALVTSQSLEYFKTKRIKDHFIRCILGTLGVIFIFASYAFLPLTSATVLLFTSSLMIPIFSAFFLKELVGPHRWGAVIIGFVGVIVMTGFSSNMPMIGIIFGLLGALFNALVMVSLKSLASSEHPLTTAFYFMFFGFLMTAPTMPFFMNGVYSLDILPYLIALAFFGSVSHISKNAMYLHLSASVAAPFPYTALIWAALFDLMIFGFLPGWSIWLGGGLVIISNLYIIVREHKVGVQKPTLPQN